MGSKRMNGNGGEQAPPSLEKIRPELNLEKWSIWELARAKGEPKPAVFERKFTGAQGIITARVKRGVTDLGTTTSEDQKIYYALIRLFEEHGRREGAVPFSLRQIAEITKRKWGSNVITSITNSLLRLRQTPFTWNNSYFDGTTGSTIKLLDTFNILSELKISERDPGGGGSSSGVAVFRFNHYIERNLIANHTKPLFLDTVLSFRSDLAQILYTFLDTILADKIRYERRTRELFEDLNLRGKAYKNLSDRKRQLQRAMKELIGIPISSGVIVSATLEKAKEGDDFKAVFCKDPSSDNLEGYSSDDQHQEVMLLDEGGGHEEEGGEDEKDPDEQAKLLVEHFYKLFKKVEGATPGKKELDHARDLIAKYGFERACYVVEFSAAEAPKTKYKPAVFGGIVQYTMAALVEYDQRVEGAKVPVEVTNCEYCSYSPGFRYVGPGNELRRCSHDPQIECAYESFGGASRAKDEAFAETDAAASEMWRSVLEVIASGLGREPVETWLGSNAITPLKIEGECRMRIRTANHVVTDWVRENFYDLIKQALREVAGTKQEWEIIFDAS